ncbi:MAG TPA: lysylphosphatidylglycerol synthase transmembrane domain-containing protein [Methylomirabilota bacterium]|nr:lysylphosphatidylglycerol synthase transmembrane domain-containing protein [Methylomirabilota bacterium]
MVVSVGLFVYLLRSVDLAELGRQLALTQWGWVVVAAGVGPLGLWTRALRWRYLFPPGSEPPGLVAANMIGYMANNVLPLRAGEFVRMYVAARRLRTERGGSFRGGLWLTGATIVVERLLDSLTLVLILAILVLLIPVPRAFEYAAVVILAIDAVAALALAALVIAPGAARGIVARLTRPWPTLGPRAGSGLDVLLRGLEGIRSPAHLVPLVAWTVVVWTIAAAGAWMLLRAVHLDLPMVAGWTVMTFVGFGISIPSAPGYLGVWHAAAVLALSLFGVSQATAVGYAVLYHASQFVPITLIGWLFLVREHVSLGEAAGAHPMDRAAR